MTMMPRQRQTLPIFALLLVGQALGQPAPPAGDKALLFKSVRIFDGKADTATEARNLLVVGNKIAKISSEPITAPAGATVLDGGGRTLTPGFIDTHIHLLFTLHTVEMKNADEMYLAFRGAREAKRTLMRGFTTIRELAGPAFGLKRAIDEGLIEGPRIYPSGAAITQTSGHGDFRFRPDRHRLWGGVPDRFEQTGFSTLADGVPEVLAAVREQLRLGATQIKLMAGGGVTSTYDPLDVAQYTDEELRAAVKAAADWGTYVAVHIYNPNGIKRAIEAGVKTIEHGHLIDEPTMKLMKEKGIFLSTQVMPFVLEQPIMTPDQKRKLAQAREGTDVMMRLAIKHGVKVTFGTDFVTSPDLMANAPKEFTARLKWFRPVDVLKQATSTAADLLALSGLRNPYPGKLGVIEEGALADLVLVDGDPLKDLKLLEDPDKNLLVIVKDGAIQKNKLP
jgi:imidazolonepropionase-like amidohydrolase